MIPKVIHYCWFGENQKPEIVQKCINSWKTFCPNYNIKEWNEQNFDIKKYKYAEQAYKAKKYAFVSDVARFDILFNEGGIYLDTDVELLKPLDSLVDDKVFLPYAQNGLISSGLIMGSEVGNGLLQDVLSYYLSHDFLLGNGRPNTTTVCTITTDVLKRQGYKMDKTTCIEKDIHFYAWDYFDPYNVETNEMRITDNTMSVHHYAGTWKSDRDMKIYKIGRILKRIVGEREYDRIARIKHKFFG